MPKKILICVTGGIAAYKTLELIRILAEKNFTIQVAMSKAAGFLAASGFAAFVFGRASFFF